jgi:hypothetical protein
VPGQGVRPHAEVVEDGEHAQADRAERRLGDLGGAERLLLPCALGLGEGRVGIDEVAQPRAVVADRALGLGQGVVHRGELAGQVAEHAEVLRSLAREEHRQPPRLGADAEIDPVRRAGDSPIRPRCDQRPGPIQDPRQVGRRALDDQQESNGLLDPEAGARAGGLGPQGVPGQVAGPGVKRGSQRVEARGREGDDLSRAVPVDRRLGGVGLLQDAVEVAPAEAEGADRGASGMIGPGEPGPRLGVDLERRVA